MTWNPSNSPISIEDFESYTTTFTGLQSAGDGYVRLVPQYSGSQNYNVRWPRTPNWTYSSSLLYSGANTGQLISFTGNGNYNSYDSNYGSYAIRTATNTASYISYTSGTSQSINTSLSGDFVIELVASAYSTSSSTSGLAAAHGLGMYVRNNQKHEFLELTQTGIHFHFNPDLNVPLDLTRLRTIRFGVRDSDIYLYTDEGIALYAPSKWNTNATFSTSLSGGLVTLGSPIYSDLTGNLSGFSGSLYVDSLKIYSGFFNVDTSKSLNQYYTSASQRFLTDIYNPNVNITRLNSLKVFHDSSPYGLTTAYLLHSSSENGPWLTGASGNLTTSPTTIYLGSLIPHGNSSDYIKVAIDQRSVNGINPPPAVDKLIIETTADNAPLKISPNWGPGRGGNVVSIQIDKDVSYVQSNPKSGETVFFIDEFTGDQVLDEEYAGYPVIKYGQVNIYESSYLTTYKVQDTLSIPNGNLNPPYLPIGPGMSQYTNSGEPSGASGNMYGLIASGNYLAITGSSYNSVYLDAYPYYDINGQQKYAQYVYSTETGAGFGYILTSLTPGNSYNTYIELFTNYPSQAAIHCESAKYVIDKYNYIDPTRIGINFTATGASQLIRVLAHNPPSDFFIDTITCEEVVQGNGDFTGAINFLEKTPRENLYIDSRFKIDASQSGYSYLIQNGPTLSDTQTTGFYVRISKDRYPEFGAYINDLSTNSWHTITGAFPLPVNEMFHLGAGISDTTVTGLNHGSRIYLTYNGQICGLREFTGVSSRHPYIATHNSRTRIFSGSYFSVDKLRVSSLYSADPEYVGQKYAGKGTPYFQMDRWYEPTGNHIVLRAANSDGALVDNSIYRVPFKVSHQNGWNTFKDAGPYGNINTYHSFFSGSATAKLPDQLVSQLGSNSGSFAFGTWLSWGGESGCLFELSNSAHNRYLSLDVDSDGALIFGKSGYALNLNNITNTGYVDPIFNQEVYSISGWLLQPREYIHLGFSIVSNTGLNRLYLHIDGERSFSGNLLVSTFGSKLDFSGITSTEEIYMSLGNSYYGERPLSVSFDETWVSTSANYYTESGSFEIPYDRESNKKVVSDKVYIDGVERSGSIHFSTSQKYLVMPSGQGNVLINTVSNSGRWNLYPESPYRYVNTYNYKFDSSDIESYFGSTVSPFKVLHTVPDNAVNISYITQQDFSVENSLSYTDLSYKTLQNVPSYSFGEYSVLVNNTGVAGSITGRKWTYNSQVDVDNISISSAAVSSLDLSFGDRLYYQHLIGNGNYGVVGRSGFIKDAIKIIDNNRNQVPVIDYPWDITYTNVSPNGTVLPSGVFGVMLLTKYPYLENRTLWVEYNGYKFSDGSYIRELREIVNTSSIYNSNDYTMSYSGSAWNLTIDNINFLNNVN